MLVTLELGNIFKKKKRGKEKEKEREKINKSSQIKPNGTAKRETPPAGRNPSSCLLHHAEQSNRLRSHCAAPCAAQQIIFSVSLPCALGRIDAFSFFSLPGLSLLSLSSRIILRVGITRYRARRICLYCTARVCLRSRQSIRIIQNRHIALGHASTQHHGR